MMSRQKDHAVSERLKQEREERFTFYREDGRQNYLELHAKRAPVGRYLPKFTDNEGAYDFAVSEAVRDFEQENDIELFLLGRSARHVCIEDTPTNRRRYDSLQRKAVEAVTALWASMREQGAR